MNDLKQPKPLDKIFGGLNPVEETEKIIEDLNPTKQDLKSNCCGESLVENTDICSKCEEHCETIKEEK